MSHKEDWPRPYNGRKFRDNYDEIFRKKDPETYKIETTTVIDQEPTYIEQKNHPRCKP